MKTGNLEREIVLWRRHFHRYPELGFEEYETSKKIQSLLKEFKIPFEIKAGTGVVGMLKGKRKGKTIGIRADMDALPVREETGLSFTSKNSGIMHACGHDGHMATLLGVAKILSKRRERIKGAVKFIFQPSEEKPPGGADRMIKEGVLNDVDNLVGFHFFPFLPLRKIWISKGPVLANTDSFEIVVEGKGGHASSPQITNDPVVCASYLVCQLQTIISRKIDPLKPAVISVCEIKGGETFNVIPDMVKLKGTVRTLDEMTREKIKDEIKKITNRVCEGFECKGKFSYKKYCPVCVNDREFSEKVEKLSKQILPVSHFAEFHPVMGGEDFAFFARKIPSCYIFIGIGKGCGVQHSSKFNLNEEVLSWTADYLSSLVCEIG